jgi:AcrR family transcriptional regulator
MDEQSIKKSYHHTNLKEKLIDKALEFLVSKPLEEISVRDLTDAVGASRTAIYRHFDSKEHLFQAVILRGFEQLSEVLEPIYKDQTMTIQEKLYKTGKKYIAFAEAYPALYRLMMGDKLMRIREERCNVEDMSLEGSFGMIVSYATQAQEEQLFKKQDPVLQAISIWAMIHGQASLIIDGHPMIKAQKEEMYEVAFSVMMVGLRV